MYLPLTSWTNRLYHPRFPQVRTACFLPVGAGNRPPRKYATPRRLARPRAASTTPSRAQTTWIWRWSKKHVAAVIIVVVANCCFFVFVVVVFRCMLVVDCLSLFFGVRVFVIAPIVACCCYRCCPWLCLYILVLFVMTENRYLYPDQRQTQNLQYIYLQRRVKPRVFEGVL